MNGDARSLLLGLVIGLLISGCGLLNGTPDKTPRPEDGAVTHPIEELGLTLDLPSDFARQDGPANASVFRFCNEAERFMRVTHCFTIESVPTLPSPDIVSWSSEPLAGGAGVFYYRTEEGGGGSGGTEEKLEGYLVLEDHIFKVRANDQEEFPGDPDATWVLPIIRTARFDG